MPREEPPLEHIPKEVPVVHAHEEHPEYEEQYYDEDLGGEYDEEGNQPEDENAALRLPPIQAVPPQRTPVGLRLGPRRNPPEPTAHIRQQSGRTPDGHIETLTEAREFELFGPRVIYVISPVRQGNAAAPPLPPPGVETLLRDFLNTNRAKELHR